MVNIPCDCFEKKKVVDLFIFILNSIPEKFDLCRTFNPIHGRITSGGVQIFLSNQVHMKFVTLVELTYLLLDLRIIFITL